MSDDKLDPAILRWARDSGVAVASVRPVEHFTAWLERLPGLVGGLDWSRIRSEDIDLTRLPGEIDRSALGSFASLFAYFKPRSPALVGPTGLMVESLDELYWKYRGRRYLCPASHGRHGAIVLNTDIVIEDDGMETHRVARVGRRLSREASSDDQPRGDAPSAY